MKLQSHDNYLEIDGMMSIQKGSVLKLIRSKLNDRVTVINEMGDRFSIELKDAELDGVPATSLNELYDYLKTNLFIDGGGSTGEGVLSVTGSLVDDTDAKNPIINFPVNNVTTNEATYQIDGRGTYTFTGVFGDWYLPLISETEGHTVRIIDWGSAGLTIHSHSEDVDGISESGVNVETRVLSLGETATFYNNSFKWVMT